MDNAPFNFKPAEKPEFKYNYNYQNWYPAVEFETKNARKNVGLFDLTAFSKYDLKGKKTHSELQKICTANVKDENWKKLLILKC